MRCEEALGCWQQELLGHPIDRAKLEEAYAHIGACQDLCARTLGTAAGFDLLASPLSRSGQTDLYEALGLSAEEEGDAHARKWARLSSLATMGKASPETVEHERAMALAAWQSAATYYQDGLRIHKTAFLSEGLERIKRKRLEPAGPRSEDPNAGGRQRGPRAALRRKPTRQASPAEPAVPPPPRPPQAGWPKLVLVSQAATRPITVRQRPAGWQINSIASGAPSVLRENRPSYGSSTPEAQRSPELRQPQAEGMLEPFALGLWASEHSQQWEIELLVRAPSPRQPWTGILLTLEDQEQQLRPTLMEFARRAPQMTGWWARFSEVAPGDYQLHLSANDARGKLLAAVTLELGLVKET
jgi:hypothetical protein